MTRAAGSPGVSVSVAEIFASIQGESTHAGRPCTFVRLAGCPLRCRWCDTEWAFDKGQTMTLAAVLAAVAEHGLALVEVTGGEPLAQSGARPLVAALCDLGHEVLVETSGAVDLGRIDPRARLIVDLKCPGSGESDRVRWDDLARLRPQDELKIVVADRSDFEWALSALERRLPGLQSVVLWSAVSATLAASELAGWLLRPGVPGRLQLQLHKILWPGRDRGV